MSHALSLASFVALSAVAFGMVFAQTCEPGKCCCSTPVTMSPTTAPSTAPTADQTLDKEEREALVAMRREEKLAHDVYVALGKRFVNTG